jgi:sigma-B regulation protein RsbU (phosphoserine phosphatase)
MTQPIPDPVPSDHAGNVSPVELPAEAPSPSILIVEDDPTTRKLLRRQLMIAGYEAEVAENGLQAWSIVGELKPDIIISDWMMPEMDGRTLCQNIKADPALSFIYFILLSAKDLREDRITGLDSGADEYLIKPCHVTEVLARVRAAQRIITLRKELTAKNQALESAMHRIHRELNTMSAIQRSLLPQKLPRFPGYAFAAWYQPSAECSGDYYDVFDLGAGRIGLIMADVSGHGTPAMVAMALARSLMHHLAPSASGPADLLMRANRLLYDHLPTSQYLTAFYAICETATGRLRYSSAGHNPPLMLHANSGTADYLEHCEGFPLKLVTPDAEYEDHEVSLESGDTLLLYTDGIPEATNAAGDPFGPGQLAKTAAGASSGSPEELIETLRVRLDGFIEETPLDDDVTALALRRE